MSIESLEIETICRNIIAAPTLELRDKIKKSGIDLSNVSYDLNQRNKIDILIDADYYWTFMTGKYKCLSPTVVLNETKFGWTLHRRFSNSFTYDISDSFTYDNSFSTYNISNSFTYDNSFSTYDICRKELNEYQNYSCCRNRYIEKKTSESTK
ncbi:hypothetical protein CEXT_256521 [Caerostris extrusa]|uniref:Uncharacterized protein n=1 Tax=Caerostris extrusa TaxID=172846 RepID=A0AAV4XZH7_CAEEX|nr:hypothetical protein CEXT_256521 [Caerostris extrusa]